jgi:hypothetical protein
MEGSDEGVPELGTGATEDAGAADAWPVAVPRAQLIEVVERFSP